MDRPVLAAIDLGAHSARMLIAQCGPKPGKISILEDLDVSVPLGSNVFHTGSVSGGTIQLLCDVFQGFRRKMEEYGVSAYRAIATSAVREAANAEILLERIRHQTGFQLQIYEGSDEARLNYIAVTNEVPEKYGFRRKKSMIADIGTGACQISTYDKGSMSFTETLKLGTMRILGLIPGAVSVTIFREYLAPVIDKAFSELRHSGADLRCRLLIATGSSVRMLFRIYAENSGQKQTARIHKISRDEFDRMRGALEQFSIKDIAGKFSIPAELAEAVMPCAIILDNLFRITGAKELIIPMSPLKKSLMHDFSNEILTGKNTFEEQTLGMVRKTSLKYYGDSSYFERVRECAETLFRKLKELHGLGPRELLLLKIAAVMHKAGLFINNQGYHKHSAYIVMATEIPGITLNERRIAAFTVRYQRKSPPRPQHTDFQALPAQDRNTVMKLSAILRIAIILTLRNIAPGRIRIKTEPGKVLILTDAARLFPEQAALLDADLDYFSYVFAVQAVLQ